MCKVLYYCYYHSYIWLIYLGTTNCGLELLQPARGTTMLVYVPGDIAKSNGMDNAQKYQYDDTRQKHCFQTNGSRTGWLAHDTPKR